MVPSEIAPTVRHPEDESEINPIKQVGPIIPSYISVVFYSPIEALQPQVNNPLNGQ